MPNIARVNTGKTEEHSVLTTITPPLGSSLISKYLKKMTIASDCNTQPPVGDYKSVDPVKLPVIILIPVTFLPRTIWYT